jgi:signal peptidase I
MRENIESLAWAVVLMLIVRVFAIQAFRIPSESMLQTLQVGDFLFISKYEYGPKIPFTHVRLPGLRKPQTGDIIVFQFPMDPSVDFIKRCIATGGQTVEIRHKQVFVDGKPLDEPYAQHIDPTELPAGTSPRDNLAPFTVPPGQLFMMGDNRENSEDGRFWGFVPMDYVKGRALFLYFSTAAQNWWTMPFHIRWNRLFRPIH